MKIQVALLLLLTKRVQFLVNIEENRCKIYESGFFFSHGWPEADNCYATRSRCALDDGAGAGGDREHRK